METQGLAQGWRKGVRVPTSLPAQKTRQLTAASPREHGMENMRRPCVVDRTPYVIEARSVLMPCAMFSKFSAC